VLAALALLPGIARAGAVQLHVVAGNRLTLHADDEPLMDVLRQLARAGVTVRADPRINAQVSIRVDNADVEKTLARLLNAYDYVIVWDVVRGPVGPFPRLSQVDVFRKGRERQADRLPSADQALEVGRDPAQGGIEYVREEILVRLKPGATLEEFRLLLQQTGATVVDCSPAGIYRLRTGPGADIPGLLGVLARHPIVDRAEPNYVYRLIAPAPVVGAAPERLVLPPESGRVKDQPVAVAVLDSGLDPTLKLGDLVAARLDATDPGRPLGDSRGHGTQMALIAMGAVSPDGSAPPGEARGVPIIAVRAFDEQGRASSFGLMRSIVYAVRNGARVINMSWTSTADSRFFQDALQYALDRDVLLVAAAGNEPTGTAAYPAAYPGVVAVSALDAAGARWSQSNYGRFIYAAAPGQASLPVGCNGPPGPYAGTSIASAFVAHALGRYVTAHPEATANEALEAFRRSLTDAGDSGQDPYYGYGAFDSAAQRRLLPRERD
jgi:hypothetical protein